MSSFEERFYIENPDPGQLLWRNLRLLGSLCLGGWFWLSRGFVLRRALRKARQRGEVILLEDVAG